MIGPNSEQLGIVNLHKALQLAEQYNLDLVEVAPTATPPVCRIMDYSKFKYDQEKKERRVKKSQHISHLKQIRLKPNINEHDYQVKLRQAISFLGKKDKVKINLFFRGREMIFKDKGVRLLERVVQDVSTCGQAEKPPGLEGRIMSVVLLPKSEKPPSSHGEDKGVEDLGGEEKGS